MTVTISMFTVETQNSIKLHTSHTPQLKEMKRDSNSIKDYSQSAVLNYLFFSRLYDRISGGAASDKNIKENVCAQIEKNFARAKWKVNPVVLCLPALLWTFRGC